MGKGAGFTLVELAMVLVIVGILAVFAAPSSSLFEGMEEAGAANEALFVLSGAQKAAIARQRPVWVRIEGGVIQACLDERCARLARRVSGAPLRLETPLGARLQSSQALFFFDSQGRLGSEAGVELEVGRKRIRVEEKTGLVRAL